MSLFLTGFIATYVSIISSISSTGPYGPASTYHGMLPYHSHLTVQVRSFGYMLEPRYIFGADSFDQ